MTLGIGVDIVSLSRMRDILETSESSFMRKVFTPWEQQRAGTHPDKVAYAAMTFAAKEAIFKTFGIGWYFGVQFIEIEVQEGEFGEPLPVLTGKFAEIAAERGVSDFIVPNYLISNYMVKFAKKFS